MAYFAGVVDILSGSAVHVFTFTCVAECVCSSFSKIEPRRDLTPSAFAHLRVGAGYNITHRRLMAPRRRVGQLNLTDVNTPSKKTLSDSVTGGDLKMICGVSQARQIAH